jgi:prolyl-tRNA editing enzyme YbaK/EbsC (Cys-tRNA(Pro) deacylase)
VLQGKKTKQCYLFVMPADLRLDMKKVKQVIGEAASFAPDPQAVTGCVPGSVPPFGSVINLKTFLDTRMGENERINFNAGSLTDSVDMKYKDYVLIEQPIISAITLI